MWCLRIFPLENKSSLPQICSNALYCNKLNDEFALWTGKMGVILHLEVWKWHSFTAPTRSSPHSPSLRRCPLSPNGHLLLLSWMDSQFADGLRVFPVNNTFLSHVISTRNEPHWQLLTIPISALLPQLLPSLPKTRWGFKHLEHNSHSSSKVTHQASSKSSVFKEPIRMVHL